MRKLFSLIFLATLIVVSCNKGNEQRSAVDDGCIERIDIPVSAHSVGSAEITELNALFSGNNIDNSQLRYYQYSRDSTQTSFPPYERYERKRVRVDGYTNGLRILNGQMVYNFKNDQFNYRAGEPTGGTSLNTTPSLSLPRLRKMFLGHIEQFDKASALYSDSCFKAEFGYFNLNAGTSYAPERLVKAWRVSRLSNSSSSDYPIAFYQDANAELIYYDNGIRYFK